MAITAARNAGVAGLHSDCAPEHKLPAGQQQQAPLREEQEGRRSAEDQQQPDRSLAAPPTQGLGDLEVPAPGGIPQAVKQEAEEVPRGGLATWQVQVQPTAAAAQATPQPAAAVAAAQDIAGSQEPAAYGRHNADSWVPHDHVGNGAQTEHSSGPINPQGAVTEAAAQQNVMDSLKLALCAAGTPTQFIFRLHFTLLSDSHE